MFLIDVKSDDKLHVGGSMLICTYFNHFPNTYW